MRARPAVIAILMAAGSSTRFGADNKLLADLDGKPLVRHVADTLAAAPLAGILVVTGHDADAVAHALDGIDASFVHNPRHLEGMGGSVATGIAALPASCDGALVITGDMPAITATDIAGLIDAFAAAGANAIVYAAAADGEQRNPVLWPRRHFARLTMLTGAAGAKPLIAAERDSAVAVTLPEAHILDIDTREDLARARLKGGGCA